MKCKQCDNEVEGRADKEFCNDSCRMKHVRANAKANAEPPKANKKVVSANTANSVKEIEHKLESLTKGQKVDKKDSGWRFRTDLYRRSLIDRIQSGEAEGTLEKHPVYGWLITRTPAQAKAYDEKYNIEARGDWVKSDCKLEPVKSQPHEDGCRCLMCQGKPVPTFKAWHSGKPNAA